MNLEEYLRERGVDAKFHRFSKSTLTVEDSSELVDAKAERVVKSLVFKDSHGNFFLVIAPGDRRVDEEKLSEERGSPVRLAKAREVEEVTGYKIGEVPPVSHELETYMDSKINDFETVFAGGGSTHALVELPTKDIKGLSDPTVLDLSD
ncbi:MAG: aminoacyl-tRNA deacylase [Candidatus Hadarchaeia archaeon]